MKWKSIALRSVCLFALTSAVAWAQSSSITGQVKDSSGAVVPGAQVSLVAHDNSIRLQTVSDKTGHYEFDHLTQNQYLLSATAKGLSSAEIRAVEAVTGTKQNADLTLSLTAVAASITVTATGTAQTAEETAKSVTVIDAQTIENLDSNTVADALAYVPGLRVEQLGGPGGATSVKTRGLRDQDTSILLDGLRLRDASAIASDASSFLQDLLLANVDRMEIMRGTGSSIYGTNATGGVINVITQNGGGKTRGTVLLEGGSLTTFRGRAGVTGSVLDGKLGYSAGIAHLNVVNGLDGNLPDRTSGTQSSLDYVVSNQTHVVARFMALDSFNLMTQSPEVLTGFTGTGVIKAIPLSASQLRLYENGADITKLNVGNANFISDYDDPDNSRAARTYQGALSASTHPSESLALSGSYQGLKVHRNFTNGTAGIGYPSSFTVDACQFISQLQCLRDRNCGYSGFRICLRD